MSQYWKQEFDNAFSALNDMLYKVKGYCYESEIGTGELNNNMQIKLIGVKADIEMDRKAGILHTRYKDYTLTIYGIIDKTFY